MNELLLCSKAGGLAQAKLSNMPIGIWKRLFVYW